MSNFHDCPDCGNYHEVGDRVMNPDWKPAAPAMREALEYGLAWMLEARGATLEAEEERQKALKVLRAALSAPQEAGATVKPWHEVVEEAGCLHGPDLDAECQNEVHGRYAAAPLVTPTPPPAKEWNPSAEYKANHLWPHEDGSIEQAGYEFANGRTPEYQEQWWNILVDRLRSGSTATGAGEAETRTIRIPSCEDHEGYLAMNVTVPWVCLECGGPRGEPVNGLSFDGCRRLCVHVWTNPCGHVEKYSAVRAALPPSPSGATE